MREATRKPVYMNERKFHFTTRFHSTIKLRTGKIEQGECINKDNTFEILFLSKAPEQTIASCRTKVISTGVAFSSAVRGGVRYTALLAIQKCGCLHSTMGCGHFSL